MSAVTNLAWCLMNILVLLNFASIIKTSASYQSAPAYDEELGKLTLFNLFTLCTEWIDKIWELEIWGLFGGWKGDELEDNDEDEDDDEDDDDWWWEREWYLKEERDWIVSNL